MGTTYKIHCLDCKTGQELDKFYGLLPPREHWPEKQFKDLGFGDAYFDPWSTYLLIGFMWKHNGHRLMLASEYDDEDTEREAWAFHQFNKPSEVLTLDEWEAKHG